MELSQLYYFQIAAYYEHITRAAEHLNISQPALSSVISRLENELGMSLFDRSGHSISLNESGAAFLKHVNQIFSEMDCAKNELRDISQKKDCVISVAVSSSQFLQGIPSFFLKNPHIKLQLRVEDNKEIHKLLRFGQIDLALASPGIYGKQFESTLLLREGFKVAAHRDHPFVQSAPVNLQSLESECFIMPLKGSSFRNYTDEIFNEAGISPRNTIECDPLLRKELVESNVGITIASKSAELRKLFNKNIRFLDIEGSQLTRDIVLVQIKNKRKSRTIQLFANFVKQQFAECSNNSYFFCN